MTDCFLSADRLASYVDGSLSAEERAGVEQHLTGCARCREELAWLESLAASVRALPREVEPSRDLWTGIERRMETEKPQRGFVVRWPVWSAAAAILILASYTVATHWTTERDPALPAGGTNPVATTASNDPQAVALATLIREVRALEDSLPPDTRALVSAQLSQIDAAIAESQVALAGGTANAAVTRMLAARYQQRLDLLEQAQRVARKS